MTIGWILVNAMWIYNMTVETGHSPRSARASGGSATICASKRYRRLLFRRIDRGPGGVWRADRDL